MQACVCTVVSGSIHESACRQAHGGSMHKRCSPALTRVTLYLGPIVPCNAEAAEPAVEAGQATGRQGGRVGNKRAKSRAVRHHAGCTSAEQYQVLDAYEWRHIQNTQQHLNEHTRRTCLSGTTTCPNSPSSRCRSCTQRISRLPLTRCTHSSVRSIAKNKRCACNKWQQRATEWEPPPAATHALYTFLSCITASACLRMSPNHWLLLRHSWWCTP